MFLTMVLYYCDLFFGLIHRLIVLQPQRVEGWLFPRHQVNLICWVRSIELAFIGGRCDYQNIETMDKVQIIDRSNTVMKLRPPHGISDSMQLVGLITVLTVTLSCCVSDPEQNKE
jgi:hypothetical protein